MSCGFFRSLMAAVCLAAASRPGWAEPLTLDGLLAEIEQRSPALRAAWAQVRAAAARPAQARALEDPTLALELWQVPVGHPEIPLMVTLRQGLPWPGKLRARGAVAAHDEAIARAEVRSLALRLRRDAARAYQDYRLAVRSLAVLGESRALLAGIVALVEGRYRVGRAELAELLEAQQAQADLDNTLLDSERQRDVAQAALNALSGAPPERPLGEPVTAPRPSSPPPAAVLYDRALAARPELLAARAALAQALDRVGAARVERAPDLALWGAYMAPLRGAAHGTFTVGVQTSLPTLSLPRAAAQAQEAAARAEALRAELLDLEARVRAEVRGALVNLDGARRHTERHREVLVPLAGRALEAARASYQSGRLPLATLLAAARGVADRRLEYERFLAECGQRQAELEAAVGGAL